MTLIAEVFPKLRTSKNMVTSMSKKSRFRGFFEKQHGKRAQICCNLKDSNFTIFLINVKAINLQKGSVSDMENLKTVF